MPKCLSCGEDNPSGVGICKKCGGRISLEEAQQSQPLDIEPGSFEEDILRLMQGGKKIEAIKLYRGKKGVDLKEAKDAVEAMAKAHNIKPSGVGCAGVLMLVAVAMASAIAAVIAMALRA
jgi:hypothetical protein